MYRYIYIIYEQGYHLYIHVECNVSAKARGREKNILGMIFLKREYKNKNRLLDCLDLPGAP